MEKGRLVQLVRDTRELEHGSTWGIGLDEDTGMECWLVFTNSFLSIYFVHSIFTVISDKYKEVTGRGGAVTSCLKR